MDFLNKVLNNPFVLVVLSGSLAFVLMYLDSKVSRVNRSQSTYYKNVGLASGLVAFSLFSSKFNYGKLANKTGGGVLSQQESRQESNEVIGENDAYEFSNEKFDD